MIRDLKRIFEQRKSNLGKRLDSKISENEKLRIEGALEEIDFFLTTINHFHDYVSNQRLLSDHLEDYHGVKGIKDIFTKLVKAKHEKNEDIQRGISKARIKDIDTSIEIPTPDK